MKGETAITTYNPSNAATSFNPKLLDTRLPDLNEDGIYVVANNPYYSFGGGFAHLTLNYQTAGEKVLYTQGTLLIKAGGIWRRHFTGSGFHVSGNFYVSGIQFQNCQFYLFSPFGMRLSDEFSIEDCDFNQVARVVSSCLYGARADSNWFNSIDMYPNDGRYRFNRMTISNNTFSNIYTSIIWGCPPVKTVYIKDNIIRDCPTAIAFFTLYQKNYSDESFFANRNREYISGNTFQHIVQGVNSWNVSLIRTSGRATIQHNRFYNCSPQIVLLYGGNTLISKNVILKKVYPDQQQAPVFLIKNIGEPLHRFSKNEVNATSSIFVALEGKANIRIIKNKLDVNTVFSKNNAIDGSKESLYICRNKINATTLTHISSREGNGIFGLVKITKNQVAGLTYFHTGKDSIAVMEVRKNKFDNVNIGEIKVVEKLLVSKNKLIDKNKTK